MKTVGLGLYVVLGLTALAGCSNSDGGSMSAPPAANPAPSPAPEPLPSPSPTPSPPPNLGDDTAPSPGPTLAMGMMGASRLSIEGNAVPPLGLIGPASQSLHIDSLPLAALTETADTDHGNCGGTFVTTHTVTRPEDPSVAYPWMIDTFGDYQDFCEKYGAANYTFDGYVSSSLTTRSENDAMLDIEYDLTVASKAFEYQQTRQRGRVNCILNAEGLNDKDCTESIDFIDGDDERYSLVDYAVSGDNDSGYDITGTFVDADDATYTFNAANLTLCDNGHFGTGTIDLQEGANAIFSLEFISCSDYVYSLEGETETVSDY